MLHEEKYYTCDRCGKRFSFTPSFFCNQVSCYTEDSVAVDFYNVERKKKSFVDEIAKEIIKEHGVQVNLTLGRRAEKYDLCHKCAKEVKDFIKKGV